MSLQYIFCSDDELLEINRTHLNHDFYTDVIGFDQSDENNTIEGDIFVSIDRITENAKDFGVSFEEELHRVMTHGLLHFVGYKDKSESEQKEMRAKESFYLNEWKA
ncbi:UNVERIFIED_CONTAM: hypothetical protein GTU68_011892 [Idotea baltica]|nr:hypothetical protein [Idotea baltica]